MVLAGCDFAKEKLGVVLDPRRLRLREKISENLGKVYREKRMRDQQLIERRMIAIEEIPIDFDSLPSEMWNLELDAKEFIVAIRVWDQRAWTLSSR